MNQAATARLDALMARAGSSWSVMGILNVTPDSFSDGGQFAAHRAAVAQGEGLAAAGAAIIDIGGESTRPGFLPVDAEEEWRRIASVIETLVSRLAVPLSVDTTKADVARRALAAGAVVVNDIWGFQGDPALPDVVAEAGAGAILMHNRSESDAGIAIVDDMLRFFERSLKKAERAGVPPVRLILDPGIGFGKTQGQQVEAIRAVGALKTFGLPVMVGLSKKSFLGRLTEAPVERRGVETLAANLAAAAGGATLFRVHDVADHVAALKVYGTIMRQGVTIGTDPQ